jgi:hypothetical protein
MRVALLILFVAGTVYVGFMFVGKSQLAGRLSSVREAAKGICIQRGSRTPTVERMTEKLGQIGDDHGVQMSDIEVTISALDGAHDTIAAAQLQAQLGGVGGLKMTGTIAQAHARMQAKQWLWRVDETLDTSCTLERKLEREMPPDFRRDTP